VRGGNTQFEVEFLPHNPVPRSPGSGFAEMVCVYM
jgi:hypothetical protein